MNIASQFESFFFQLQTKVRKLFTNPCIWRQRNPCCPQAHGVLNFSLTEKTLVLVIIIAQGILSVKTFKMSAACGAFLRAHVMFRLITK